MRRSSRRPAITFVLGALAAGAVFAGGVAYGALGSETVNACVKKGSGALYLPGGKGCQPGDSPLEWNVQGPPGPEGPAGPAGPPGEPGEFSGSLESPNGLFSIQVGDSGILLKGPGGSVKIDNGSVTAQGAVGLSLNGPIVSINGGCSRVMRQAAGGTTASGSVYTC